MGLAAKNDDECRRVVRTAALISGTNVECSPRLRNKIKEAAGTGRPALTLDDVQFHSEVPLIVTDASRILN